MWLLKTEPGTYSYEDLERDGETRWDGVANPAAVRNIRAMKVGDRLIVYHTGDVKAAVGLAEVVKAPYPDPKKPGLAVMDIAARGRLPRPVPLSEIKSLPVFADSPLVKQGRLSVVALTAEQMNALTGARK
jgi:predicted RNA-binding protein with PUA-like domain